VELELNARLPRVVIDAGQVLLRLVAFEQALDLRARLADGHLRRLREQSALLHAATSFGSGM
jgi:hypothetical protein